MDFDATQVLKDRQTVNYDDDDKGKKQIGTLSIGSTDYRIMEGLNRIGRSLMCTVVLKDPTVSKVHAEIQAGPEATFITDLRSANGTTLKNLPLKTFFFYPINDGDVVVFGRVTATYTILKKSSERSIDVTPKTPDATGARNAIKKLASNLSFDDPNDSVIPGSQKNVEKQRLFHRPAMHIDHQKIRARIGETKKSENVNDSTDIYDMETQDIVGRRKNTGNGDGIFVAASKDTDNSSNIANKSGGMLVGKSKRAKEPDDGSPRNTARIGETNKSENVNDSTDIYDMETQDIVGRRKNTGNGDGIFVAASKDTDNSGNIASKSGGMLVGKSKRAKEPDDGSPRNTNNLSDIHSTDIKLSKRPRFQTTANVYADRHDDNTIYEAETQVLVMAEKLPNELTLSADAGHERSNANEENMIEKESARKEFHVIAETDDESKTDNEMTDLAETRETGGDLSDGSITDEENKFASFGTTSARNEQRSSAINADTAVKRQSKPVTNIYEAETQQINNIPPRKIVSCAVRRIIDDEVDIDLLPTQVLDVATSTPIPNEWTARPNDNDTSREINDIYESQELVKLDEHLHGMLMEDPSEKKFADSSSGIPAKVDKGRKMSDDEDDTALNSEDTLDKNMGNIFGDEATSEVESTDEPTQLMTQNLVDILKPTQNMTREATAATSITEKTFISDEIAFDDDTSGKSQKTPKIKKRIEAAGTLGFVDGRGIDSHDEFLCPPTSTTASTSKQKTGKTEAAGGSVVSDPSKATVLITDKIRRTFKFLCSVAQGTKIVSIKWLAESNKAGHFLDCDSFILRDPDAEEKYRFRLADSLRIARTSKLLAGYTIIVTPKVNQPEIHELKGMVEACGGRVLVRAGRSWDKKTIIISGPDDLAAAKALLSKSPRALKITVQSTEFLLSGILRQEVNLVDHKLL